MGQFAVVKDKRLPYETDIHLPAYVRGPGISQGIVVQDAVLNIDFFPTFLDIAGVWLLPICLTGQGCSHQHSLMGNLYCRSCFSPRPNPDRERSSWSIQERSVVLQEVPVLATTS